MQSWPPDLGTFLPARNRPLVPARTLNVATAPTRAARLLLLLALCLPPRAATTEPFARPPKRKAQAFAAGERTWRDERQAETDPARWLDQPDRPALARAGQALLRQRCRQRHPPGRGSGARRHDFAQGRSHPLRSRDKAALTLDGQPLAGAVTLVSDADAGADGPSKLGFDEGKGVLTVIKRGDRYALRVKHADAPTRIGFRGIEYWPGGPDWVVKAKFVPHAAGQDHSDREHHRHHRRTSPNPGAVEFQRDGKTYPHRGAGRRRRRAVPGVRRSHQRPWQLSRGPFPGCADARCERHVSCSTSTRATTRRARSRRSLPARCRRRKTALTSRSLPARRPTTSRSQSAHESFPAAWQIRRPLAVGLRAGCAGRPCLGSSRVRPQTPRRHLPARRPPKPPRSRCCGRCPTRTTRCICSGPSICSRRTTIRCPTTSTRRSPMQTR